MIAWDAIYPIIVKLYYRLIEADASTRSIYEGIEEPEDQLRRIKLQSFLSTPNFIKCLTDISAKLSEMKASTEEKR